jgi:competence protein ComEC
MILIWLSCAWVAGIFLGSRLAVPPAMFSMGLAPLILVLYRRSLLRPAILALLALFVMFGANFYYTSNPVSPGPITVFNNQGEIEFQGRVNQPPESKDQLTHLQVAAEKIFVGSGWQSTGGTILLFVPRYPEYHLGDLVLIKGELEQPSQFQDFDYQAFLARKGVFSTMLSPHVEIIGESGGFHPMSWVYHIRERLAKVLALSLPEPQASLAQGIVLGIRNTIPDDLKGALSTTGTAQLLAISGINLTILTGLLIALGRLLFGRRHYIYVWLALVSIWFYAVLTGLQAPVIRAAIMASVFLLAERLGRQKNAFPALAMSAAVMTGINPQVLWDISFQLSFLAMTGLIFLTPLLQGWCRQGIRIVLGEDGILSGILIFIGDSLSITIGAILAVWALVAYYFGIVSLVGPLATLLIAPALPVIIFTGVLTSAIGLISSTLSQAAGWITLIPLSYMLWLTRAFADVPLAAINTGQFSVNLVWAYYASFSALLILKTNSAKLGKPFSRACQLLSSGFTVSFKTFSLIPKKFFITPLLALGILASLAANNIPDDKLHVSFLDVGEGDATLIQTAGQNILIDGGPSPQAVCLGLSSKLRFWQRNIDLIILSHPHLDHLSGLVEVLKRYKVKKILAPDLSADSPICQEWQDQINRQGIEYLTATAGQSITLSGGANIEILNPHNNRTDMVEPDLENDGIVLRLNLKNVSFLFTADIYQEAEAKLVNNRADLACTVLKVSHHGSDTSSSSQFLSAAKPRLAVISVGDDNTFGHPDADVLTRLKQILGSDNNIFRTDNKGTVEFTTDGESLWVKTEKP